MSSNGARMMPCAAYNSQSGFGVLDDLQDVARFEQQLQPIEHVAQWQLAFHQHAVAEEPAVARRPVAHRHVEGQTGRGRERHAHEFGPARIERRGLGIDGHHSRFVRCRDHGIERFEGRHGAIARVIETARTRFRSTGDGEPSRAVHHR